MNKLYTTFIAHVYEHTNTHKDKPTANLPANVLASQEIEKQLVRFSAIVEFHLA